MKDFKVAYSVVKTQFQEASAPLREVFILRLDNMIVRNPKGDAPFFDGYSFESAT